MVCLTFQMTVMEMKEIVRRKRDHHRFVLRSRDLTDWVGDVMHRE